MVQGLAELQARMDAIPKRVRQAVAAEMEKSANEVVALMQQFAARRTGAMAESIGWTWGEAPKGSITVGSVGGKSYGSLRITIYAGGKSAFWARFQEFGTIKMPAHPFFFPAWRVKRRAVKSRITRAVNKALKEG